VTGMRLLLGAADPQSWAREGNSGDPEGQLERPFGTLVGRLARDAAKLPPRTPHPSGFSPREPGRGTANWLRCTALPSRNGTANGCAWHCPPCPANVDYQLTASRSIAVHCSALHIPSAQPMAVQGLAQIATEVPGRCSRPFAVDGCAGSQKVAICRWAVTQPIGRGITNCQLAVRDLPVRGGQASFHHEPRSSIKSSSIST
jgi:hypothetical protein